MTDTVWVRVTPCENIPIREGRATLVAGWELAIFNTGDGRFLATRNHCPHQGGPLCDGIVTGASVVCPLHAWKVSLDSGEVVRPTGTGRCVDTFPTRVEDGVIAVALPVERAHAAHKENAA